jgi:hypothetical protein
MADQETIVYGARCVWWDSLGKVALLPSGLPCCPHCRSVLFQTDGASWWASVDKHEQAGNPGYRRMIEWSRGRCFRTLGEMEAAFAAAAVTSPGGQA